jgi:hypothetical protein
MHYPLLFLPEMFTHNNMRLRVELKNEGGAGLKALLNPQSLTTAANAGALHRDLAFAKLNQSARSTELTEQSFIPPNLAVEMMDSGKDVMYVEGFRNGTGTLSMRLVIGGWKRAHIENTLDVRVSDVEDFYLHANLRGACGDTDKNFPDRPTADALPDALCNDTVAVWIHGFDTSAEESAYWHSRIFKHKYQSGSFARYHAVTWLSDQGALLVKDYHQNVINAFATAPYFAAVLSQAKKGQYTRVVPNAHSLGNMVTSSAIKDYNVTVALYNSINSAVPSEAYDAALHNAHLDINGAPNWLIHPDWREQQILPRAYASWWSLLWPSGDLRSTAAWAGRFDGLAPVMHNYVAPYEEVLEIKTNGTLRAFWSGVNIGSGFAARQYAWHKQELYKGRPTLRVTGGLISSRHMGWGFEWGIGEVTQQPFNATWTANPPRCEIELPGLMVYAFRPIGPGDKNTMAKVPGTLLDYMEKFQGEYELWLSDLGYRTPAFLLCKPAEEFAWRVTWPKESREAAATAPNEELRENPVFLKNPPVYFEKVPVPAITANAINDRLADAIPALSPPTGILLDGPFAKTFNLEAVNMHGEKLYKANDADWPRASGWMNFLYPFDKRWMHADFVNMEYIHTRKFWLNLVNEGGFHVLPAP